METGSKQTINIYGYSSFRVFLADYILCQKKSSRFFSQRKFSKDLGVKSQGTLTMILKGKRNPSSDLVNRMASAMGLSNPQRIYFENLAQLAKVEGQPEKASLYIERLRALHPNKEMKIIPYEMFFSLSNWYCLPIREMVQAEDFIEDPAWISKKLKRKITSKQAQAALENLQKAGLLVRDSSGKLQSADKEINTQADWADEGVKRFHEQMLTLAKDSLRNTPVLERDFGGSTFNIDPKDLPELKRKVREFRRTLYQAFEKPKGTATYQLNVQLFPLTQSQETSS